MTEGLNKCWICQEVKSTHVMGADILCCEKCNDDSFKSKTPVFAYVRKGYKNMCEMSETHFDEYDFKCMLSDYGCMLDLYLHELVMIEIEQVKTKLNFITGRQIWKGQDHQPWQT